MTLSSDSCPILDASSIERLLNVRDETSLDLYVAEHIQSCSICRSRLDALTNACATESEAKVFLADAGSYNPYSNDHAESLFETNSSDDVRSTPQPVCLTASEQQVLDPPSHPELLGRIGRYEVERKIGSGGMGVVFKAFDSELNRPVAIKVLLPHLASVGAARQRFSRESRAAASISHDNIVPIHNVESNEKFPYLVMQYVPGESLQSRIDREGRLSASRILQIGLQTALGLAAAHQQGIVHRDIKPANLLLENGVDRLFITDFGLARIVDDASLTNTGIVAGTPNYMSPEQAKGELTDHRTDLFSLGAVLYFAATGHPPFRAENAMGVLNRICHEKHRSLLKCDTELPEVLCKIIDKLLEKNPAKRFQDANALAQNLQVLMQTKDLTRNGKWRRRVKHLAFSSLALAIPMGIYFSQSQDVQSDKLSRESNSATNDLPVERSIRKQPPLEAITPQRTIGPTSNSIEEKHYSRNQFDLEIGQIDSYISSETKFGNTSIRAQTANDEGIQLNQITTQLKQLSN